jgi:hypothetical protein
MWALKKNVDYFNCRIKCRTQFRQIALILLIQSYDCNRKEYSNPFLIFNLSQQKISAISVIYVPVFSLSVICILRFPYTIHHDSQPQGVLILQIIIFCYKHLNINNIRLQFCFFLIPFLIN